MWTITFDLHDKSTSSKVAPSEVSLCFCFVCSQSEPHGGMKLCSETGYVSWVTVCQLLYGHVISKAWIAGFICYLFACLFAFMCPLPSMSSVIWCRKGIGLWKTEWWVLVWLSAWSELQTCIRPSWCHCHSLSLVWVKSRLILPFWYWLTCVCVRACRCAHVRACVCVCISHHVCSTMAPWYWVAR